MKKTKKEETKSFLKNGNWDFEKIQKVSINLTLIFATLNLAWIAIFGVNQEISSTFLIFEKTLTFPGTWANLGLNSLTIFGFFLILFNLMKLLNLQVREGRIFKGDLTAGLFLGLFYGLITAAVYELNIGLILGLSIGLFYGLILNLAYGLILGLVYGSIAGAPLWVSLIMGCLLVSGVMATILFFKSFFKRILRLFRK